jgi:Sulfotransferase domain
MKALGAGSGPPGGNGAGQDAERGLQGGLRDDGEDVGVLPFLAHSRPVVVGGDERPTVDRIEPIAVDVSEIEVAFYRPGHFFVLVIADDPDGDIVESQRVIAEGLAVHVYDERVVYRSDGGPGRTHEHSRAVDGDMAVRVRKDLEYGVGFCRDRPLRFQPFSHPRESRGIAARVWPGASFWPELLEANPEALVILSIRDPESWYTSASNTRSADGFRPRSYWSGLLSRAGTRYVPASEGRFWSSRSR